MKSHRVSTSPVRGVKGGGLGLKSTKEFSRFRYAHCTSKHKAAPSLTAYPLSLPATHRVLERPGACVGIADLDNKSALYPFYVDCTSPTYLFSITVMELKSALNGMFSADKTAVRAVLTKEHAEHVKGLKYEPPKIRRTSTEQRAHDNAKQAALALSLKCESTLDSLQVMRANSRLLKELVFDLRGDSPAARNSRSSIIASSSGSPTGPGGGMLSKNSAAAKSRKILATSGRDSKTDRNQEELEARTGYSTQAGSDDNQSIAMRMAA